MSQAPRLVHHDPVERLLEPYRYTCRMPGKQVRSKVIKAFELWLNIPEEHEQVVKDIVESLHNASLIIDDIEDNSKLRRGNPVAHSVYGLPWSLNTANYVYFLALQKVHNTKNAEAMAVFTEELLNLHRGQGWDIYWRDTQVCPSEEEYRQMVLDKTGGLFRLGLKLMQAFSENKTDFTKLVNYFSLFFQILDDLLNLSSEKYTTNKSYCEDLSEGKYSFVILHSINATPDDHRLLSILKQHTEDVDKKKYAVQVMKETKSFEYTRKVLWELHGDIVKEIEALGGNEMLVSLLDVLAQEIDKEQE
eukprot:GFYU01006168.1.p1 GENE.GFYU01006168.1~~GFYU01006168.1.p1  ORF type:complete len:305 (-),score=93.89 GFYU01006168.1:191-1105(-)